MRVLLDTNVFVAALLRSASCRSILESLRDGAFTLITSDPLINELVSVLGRAKFADSISSDDIRELLELIRREGRFVTPKSSPVAIRDPNDRLVLNCLYAADWLVTGDHDLQVLLRVGPSTILSPQAFLSRLAKR